MHERVDGMTPDKRPWKLINHTSAQQPLPPRQSWGGTSIDDRQLSRRVLGAIQEERRKGVVEVACLDCADTRQAGVDVCALHNLVTDNDAVDLMRVIVDVLIPSWRWCWRRPLAERGRRRYSSSSSSSSFSPSSTPPWRVLRTEGPEIGYLWGGH